MARRPRRRCLRCSRLIRRGSYCWPECDWRAGYHRHAYITAARRFIDEHLAAHGALCPGAGDLDHDPHPVDPTELTVDHIEPPSRGGRVDDPANWRVLCAAANRERSRR